VTTAVRSNPGAFAPRRLAVIGALVALSLFLVPSPALAQAYGPYECESFGSTQRCWGYRGIPGHSGSDERTMWNYYCRAAPTGVSGGDFGVYPPDRTDLTPEQLESANDDFVRVFLSSPLSAAAVEALNMNPTGSYTARFVECWLPDRSPPYYPAQPPPGYNASYWAGLWSPYIIEDTPPIDPEAWRDQVAATIAIDPPPVQMAPAPDLQAVNVASWIWLADGYGAPEDHTAVSTRGVAELTIIATPIELTFRPGTGEVVSCDIDAPAWVAGADPTTGCTHTYTAPSPIASPFTATVTVTWEYRWTFETIERLFVDNEAFFTTAVTTAVDATVDELQILETG
jgi:hypothetical protein